MHAALVAFIALAPATALAQVWEAPVREIPRNDLPDVAMASFDGYGPVIYYNPMVVAQAGPVLAAFFRAHEYGHINLKHMQREAFDANPYNRVWVRQSYEKEADCFAAKTFARMNPELVATAAQFFRSSQGPGRPDWLHPTGYERAEVIERCAREVAVDQPSGQPTIVTEPCHHAMHPDGDPVPCTHPAHPMGDVVPCQHACYDFYGRMFQCHPMGDVIECSHAMHHSGDRVYCVHPAHPEGDKRPIFPQP